MKRKQKRNLVNHRALSLPHQTSYSFSHRNPTTALQCRYFYYAHLTAKDIEALSLHMPFKIMVFLCVGINFRSRCIWYFSLKKKKQKHTHSKSISSMHESKICRNAGYQRNWCRTVNIQA